MSKKTKRKQRLAAAQANNETHQSAFQQQFAPESQPADQSFVGQTLLELLEREGPAEPSSSSKNLPDTTPTAPKEMQSAPNAEGPPNVPPMQSAKQQKKRERRIRDRLLKKEKKLLAAAENPPPPPVTREAQHEARKLKNKAKREKEKARKEKRAAAAKAQEGAAGQQGSAANPGFAAHGGNLSSQPQGGQPSNAAPFSHNGRAGSEAKSDRPKYDHGGAASQGEAYKHNGTPDQAAPYNYYNHYGMYGQSGANGQNGTYGQNGLYGQNNWTANQQIVNNLAGLLGYNVGWNGNQQPPSHGQQELGHAPIPYFPFQGNPQNTGAYGWGAAAGPSQQGPLPWQGNSLATMGSQFRPYSHDANAGAQRPAFHGAGGNQNPALAWRGPGFSRGGKVPKVPVPIPTAEYMAQAEQEPKPLGKAQRLLVVMDLNGTLMYRSKTHGMAQKREGLAGFLDYLFENFAVMVWSSARPENVDRACSSMFTPEQRQKVVAEWARDMLGLTPLQYKEKVQVYKELSKIWKVSEAQRWHDMHNNGQKFGPHNTVLLDDSILKASSEPYNLIQVPEFTKSGEADGLGVLRQVAAYLDELKMYDNVSAVIKRVPFVVGGRWRNGGPLA